MKRAEGKDDIRGFIVPQLYLMHMVPNTPSTTTRQANCHPLVEHSATALTRPSRLGLFDFCVYVEVMQRETLHPGWNNLLAWLKGHGMEIDNVLVECHASEGMRLSITG